MKPSKSSAKRPPGPCAAQARGWSVCGPSAGYASKDDPLPRQRRRPAFTLVELVMVMAATSLLLAIVLPMLVAHRTRARIITCQDNCRDIAQATSAYLADNGRVFPGGYYHGVEISRHNLLGKTGAASWWFPALTKSNDRVLNAYLQDKWNSSQCPLDLGNAQTGSRTAHDFYGTSYYYFDRTRYDITHDRLRGESGVWAIEAHRFADVAHPDRKLVFADEIVRARRRYELSRHRWHNGDRPLHVSISFADAHVDHLPRKTVPDEQIEAFSRSTVIDQTTIDQWAAKDDYY